MRKFACILLLAAVMACTKDSEEISADTSDVPICVGVGISSSGTSNQARTPFPDIASGTTSGIRMRGIASLNSSFSTAFYANGPISLAAAATAGESNLAIPAGFETKVYYPANPATQVWLVGLYPESTGWGSSGTSLYGKAMNVYDDIMTSPAVSTNKGAALAGTYSNLAMQHRLTMLTVQVVGASSSETVWGKLQRIALTGAKSRTTGYIAPHPARFIVNLATNATTFSGSQTSITLCKPGTDVGFFGQAVNITTELKTVAYGIFQPVRVASSTETVYTLEVSTQRLTSPVSVPVTIDTIGETEGKSYVITLTFGPAYEIKAAATVTEWIEGTTGSGTATL